LELKSGYGGESPYQVLERIFSENFALVESNPRPKENSAITSSCLQSVDDLEATYRTKGTGHYKGYVVNVAETCDPDNPLQLITKIQVAPNNVDDTQLLAEALPDLKERTGVETMITDGGYGGESSDAALQAQQVQLIQTAIRRLQPNPEKLHLSDFELQSDQQGRPIRLTCSGGQTVCLTHARQSGWQARFDPVLCAACPFQQEGRCRAKPQKRDTRYLLAFTDKESQAAHRRKAYLAHKGEWHNLRSAVEATMRSVKYAFPARKLPVRGQFRVTCMMIASAATTNVRRIQRYLDAKTKRENELKKASNEQECAQGQLSVSFFASLKVIWKAQIRPFSFRSLCLGC
jgi:hypothetical protein